MYEFPATSFEEGLCELMAYIVLSAFVQKENDGCEWVKENWGIELNQKQILLRLKNMEVGKDVYSKLFRDSMETLQSRNLPALLDFVFQHQALPSKIKGQGPPRADVPNPG